MNRSRTPLALACAALLSSAVGVIATAPAASAAGDYGPDTCLEGYVWRDARPGDHVCVSPATRSQAAADNSQAANRRSPNGGAYGPDTCHQGYVWREAFAGDHVCVTPTTRSQAAADNSQAANRRASHAIWITKYSAEERHCDGEVCSTNNDTAPRTKVNGDHFNVNVQVKIVLARQGSNQVIKTFATQTRTQAGFVAGTFGHKTGLLSCAGSPNAYIQAYDPLTRRWSNRVPVTTGCSTL